MAPRRTRPPQPLAPHGIPGHLVEFVEALRRQGISVGPSETVDAGQVMATLGLGNREVLREGLACAVLRRPDHRDTYDVLFDLYFPAALGARPVLSDDDTEEGLPPEDIEALRSALVDMLADNDDVADLDERLAAMIAQIVEAYGRYNSSRGPSYSSYQALKSMSLNVGALKLSSVCGEIERLAPPDAPEAAARLMRPLRTALAAALAAAPQAKAAFARDAA